MFDPSFLNSDPFHWEHGVVATGPPGKSLNKRNFIKGQIEFFLHYMIVYNIKVSQMSDT